MKFLRSRHVHFLKNKDKPLVCGSKALRWIKVHVGSKYLTEIQNESTRVIPLFKREVLETRVLFNIKLKRHTNKLSPE